MGGALSTTSPIRNCSKLTKTLKTIIFYTCIDYQINDSVIKVFIKSGYRIAKDLLIVMVFHQF
ncbi:MAG: hypothetical protein CVU39_01585 [Chloroflexi bacterium HGW-Chloroflexi-10]|nr:MAG: hypothetical protein CVU39_01585 [Chloroflexi bacterium HGW-Chloroflexi-10]